MLACLLVGIVAVIAMVRDFANRMDASLHGVPRLMSRAEAAERRRRSREPVPPARAR